MGSRIALTDSWSLSNVNTLCETEVCSNSEVAAENIEGEADAKVVPDLSCFLSIVDDYFDKQGQVTRGLDDKDKSDVCLCLEKSTESSVNEPQYSDIPINENYAG